MRSPGCKAAQVVTDAEAEWLGLDAGSDVEVCRPVGCDRCNHTGYRGRTGIYELIEVDDAMRSMIHEGASEMAMLKVARKKAPGILQDGQRRVLSGQTSMEEVMRVTTAG